jgi:hypothetical protein
MTASATWKMIRGQQITPGAFLPCGYYYEDGNTKVERMYVLLSGILVSDHKHCLDMKNDTKNAYLTALGHDDLSRVPNTSTDDAGISRSPHVKYFSRHVRTQQERPHEMATAIPS